MCVFVHVLSTIVLLLDLEGGTERERERERECGGGRVHMCMSMCVCVRGGGVDTLLVCVILDQSHKFLQLKISQ